MQYAKCAGMQTNAAGAPDPHLSGGVVAYLAVAGAELAMSGRYTHLLSTFVSNMYVRLWAYNLYAR